MLGFGSMRSGLIRSRRDRTPDNWGEGQFAMSDFLGPQTLEMSLRMSEIWAIKRSKVGSRIGKIRLWDNGV